MRKGKGKGKVKKEKGKEKLRKGMKNGKVRKGQVKGENVRKSWGSEGGEGKGR